MSTQQTKKFNFRLIGKLLQQLQIKNSSTCKVIVLETGEPYEEFK